MKIFSSENLTDLIEEKMNNPNDSCLTVIIEKKVESSDYLTKEIEIKNAKSYDFYLDNDVIKDVSPNGTAGRAGLLENDIILTIDDINVESWSHKEISDRLHQGLEKASIKLTVKRFYGESNQGFVEDIH